MPDLSQVFGNVTSDMLSRMVLDPPIPDSDHESVSAACISSEKERTVGFLDDIWTALLSDDAEEEGSAIDRIEADPVASQIAQSALKSIGDCGDRESGGS